MRRQFIISLLLLLVITCVLSSLGIGIFFKMEMDEIIVANLDDTLKQVDSSLKLLDFVKNAFEIDLNAKADKVLPEIARELGDPTKAYTSRELKKMADRYGVDEIFLINRDMVVFNTSCRLDMNLDLHVLGDTFVQRLEKVYGKGKVYNQASILPVHSDTFSKYAYYSPKGTDYIIEISYDLNEYLRNRYSSNYNIQIFFEFLKDMPESNRYLVKTDLLCVKRNKSKSYLYKGVTQILSQELKDEILNKKIVKQRDGYRLRVYYDETLQPYLDVLDPQSTSVPRILVLEFDFSPIGKLQNKVIVGTIVSILIACLSAGLLFVPFIFRRYFQRIDGINKALSKLALGEFDEPIEPQRNDELGNIACNISKMGQEITTREAALKENEENLSITLKCIGDAVIVTDFDGLVVRMNPVAEKLTGRTFLQAQGRHLAEVFHIVQAETRLQLENPVEKVIITGEQQTLANDTMLITPDGREYQIADSAAPIRTESGELLGVVMVFRDVSEEYQRKKILQKQQALMAATFKLAPFGMVIMKAGIVLDANDRFLSILGYDRDEIVGHTTQKLYTSYDDYVRVCEQHKKTAENMTTLDEYIWRHKSGREINILIAMAPLESHAEGEDIVTVMDVTERKKMEKTLTQSQKMEAVGQLAGGMAHDLNSFFTSISGYAEMLQVPDLPETEKNSYAHKILKTVDQAARLNAQLVSFSRKNKIFSSNLGIHSLIGSTMDIIRDNIPDNIELDLRMNARRDVVLGDISLLKSAIVTLCINAKGNLSEGGTITISTTDTMLSEEYCQASPFNLVAGEYIKISVADTGPGISKENIDRIFEPFFSTGESAKESGLGLAAVYGTVVSHKGEIDVHSELGAGSIFNIYLPLISATKAISAENVEVPEKQQGSILVIDDEPLIRNMAKAQLDALGYSALTAADGQEGLKLFVENKPMISLVIVDIIMPVMDGYETIKAIRQVDPDVKIVITSGFSASPKVEQLIKEGNCEYLQKPMQLSRLASIISKMLNN